MSANKKQIGGTHYKKGSGEEHWDRAWRLKYDPFQYIITKWVERWRDKGGVEDLEKARHAIDKYIEVVLEDLERTGTFEHEMVQSELELRGYVNQDRDLDKWL